MTAERVAIDAMRAVVALMLAGCGSRPPDVASASVATTRVAALPTSPALGAQRLAGPFPTISDACHSAKPCGGRALDESGKIIAPDDVPQCALDHDDPNDANGQLRQPPSARLAPVICDEPSEVRGVEARYYLFVRRDDGWWRSGPLFTLSYNEKYCSGALSGGWTKRAVWWLARVDVEHSCLTCSKRAYEIDRTRLLFVVDPAGATPIVYRPIVEAYGLEIRGADPSDSECNETPWFRIVDEHWSAPDELELVGPPTWFDAPLPADTGLAIGAITRDDALAVRRRYLLRR